jgi:hypothetical protein
LFLAVDPGVFGAVAVIETGKTMRVSRLVTLPRDAAGLAMLLRLLDDNSDVEMVAVERQSAMPRQGRTSIASQMTAYGVILGACAALGLRVECVAPVQWKRLAGAVVQSVSLNTKPQSSGSLLNAGKASSDSKSQLTFGSLLNAGKAASLAHARAVPGFVDAMPARTSQAVQIGMADATLIGLVGYRLATHRA